MKIDHILAAVLLLMAIGCASTSSTTVSEIPADSPLAKIVPGMGRTEVASILGPPNDFDVYSTGKGWNPFYFGSDRVRTTHYYKGVGRVVMGGNRRVIRTEYDPTEDGFK